ncbi:MAG: hypothetical protein A2167_00245 [Planctomycetes bacterium RBG_13_46_10]|nr:MAG: hypothetical protein A2167_00245 [Planctomycetes bacterium RBG_13_46_10]
MLNKGHIKVLLWRLAEFLTQWIRALRVSLLPLRSLKNLCQPKFSRFYIKLIIPAVLIGMADISSAKSTNYSSRGISSFSPIKNPYNADEYMSRLAEKLPQEQRNLLLRGNELNKELTEKSKKAVSGTGMNGEESSSIEEPWSLKKDLEKYRAYAVKEGSRYSDENLTKALEHLGLFVEDGINVFTLGYGSDRGLPFRANDGNDISWHAQTVAEQAILAFANFTDGIYSIIDLIAFDLLADIRKDVYRDNNPVVRPFIFTGRTIGCTWKTTENIGNTLTLGYFDNVTGSAAMCVGDIIESLKQGGQAVTNLPREVIFLTVGIDEDTDKMLDWLLVVPWELASNIIEMQGIANMQDYSTAFKEKGVVGSILEFSGSAIITYCAIDELIDELDNDHKDKRAGQSQGSSGSGGSGGGGGGGGDDGGIIDTGDDIFYFWYPL